MTKKWQDILIPKHLNIIEILKKLDTTAMQILFVTDSNNTLLGSITDGDVRRSIIEKNPLETIAEDIMNIDTFSIPPFLSTNEIKSLMLKHSIHQIPVIDKSKRILSVEIFDEIVVPSSINNPVVIMAGGLGKRLKSLTEECPKPLLKIGNKPIIDIIIERLIAQGFNNFYLAVNYKAKMFEEYFGDGSSRNVSIKYLKEKDKLGTAGPLSLMKESNHSIIVMNGDLITQIDYRRLVDFHESKQSIATMCVKDYTHEVPFGVIKASGENIVAIEEKPTYQEYINAGVYCLSPDITTFIPKNKYFDMPSLFNKLISANKKLTIFPLSDYWLDIGQPDEYQQAKDDYAKYFL